MGLESGEADGFVRVSGKAHRQGTVVWRGVTLSQGSRVWEDTQSLVADLWRWHAGVKIAEWKAAWSWGGCPATRGDQTCIFRVVNRPHYSLYL